MGAPELLALLLGMASGSLLFLSAAFAHHWLWERRAGYRPRLIELMPSAVGIALAAACWAVILLVLAE